MGGCREADAGNSNGVPVVHSHSHACADCTANDGAPTQGDVRLIALDDILPTQTCDTVHFGGVEFFNDGQWGRVCSGRFGGNNEDFTIDAKVVCKQLGFPFGSLYDAEEVANSTGNPAGSDYVDYSAPGELVWATDVLCTGKEERLDECFFPEDFGDARNNDYSSAPDVGGIRAAGCRRRDGSMLGVVCRQFEIEGVLRLHTHTAEPPLLRTTAAHSFMASLPYVR